MGEPNPTVNAGNAGFYCRSLLDGANVADDSTDLSDPCWMIISTTAGAAKITTVNDETLTVPLAAGVPVYVGIKRLWDTGHATLTSAALRVGR